MIQFNKFKLNVGVRSRSVQKKLSEDEIQSPSLRLVKKRSSQCRESSTGDQSTLGFTDAFQDSPKANKNSIDRFSSHLKQNNSQLTQSLILSNPPIIREQDNMSPPPKQRTVPLYTQNIEEFNKNYQILKLFSSDSPSKKQRKLLTPFINSNSPLLHHSNIYNKSRQKSKDISNNELSPNQANNLSNFYLTNVPSSFEDHYKQIHRQVPLQRNLRAHSLSTSPKKNYLNLSGLTTIPQIKSSQSSSKTPQQIKEEEDEKLRLLEEQKILKFDNLVKHRLQKQMIELNQKEIDAFYNNSFSKEAGINQNINQKGQQQKINIPYSLYLMKKDRDLLIDRLKELHKQPRDKMQIVKENIIKEVRIKNLQNHQLLDKMIHEEDEKYKEDLISKNPNKSTIYNVYALNQKSQSRVKARLAEELPMISRFNTQL